MLPLLRLISLRHVQRMPGQSLRAAVAVAIGVASLIAITLVNRSISTGFEQNLDAAAGRTDLQITGGEAGVPDELIDRVRELDSIEAAVPRLQASAGVLGSAGEMITVLGVDITEEGRVRRYTTPEEAGEQVVDDPLVFLSQADSIIVTHQFAERHHLELDAPLELVTPTGKRKFVIRGLLAPKGPAVAFGGNLAVMDYQAAQIAFGRRRRVDAIDVLAKDRASLPALTAQLRATVGPDLQVEPPRARAADMARATSSMRTLFSFFSSLALIVGMFLTYNTVSMTVAQRGREVALLRALGVVRAHAIRVFIFEALVIGLVGAGMGILLGVALARAMASSVARSISIALLTDFSSLPAVQTDPALAVLGLGAGLGTTLLAAWFAARQAARFAPATATRIGALQALRQTQLPSPRYAAACLALGALITAVARFPRLGLLGPAADLAFIGGFGLLAPSVIRVVVPPLARALQPLGALGRVAALNLLTNLSRSGLTTAPLMVAVALVVTVGTVTQSFRDSFVDWTQSWPADLQIASVSQEFGRNVLLPGHLADDIARVPGVARAYRFRMIRLTYSDRRVALEATEYDRSEPCCARLRAQLPDALGKVARGEAVLLSENFVDKFDIRVGEMLELPTPKGMQRFPVAGIATSFNSDQGSISMAYDRFVELFGDDRVDYILLLRQPGTGLDQVRDAIAARYGDQFQLVFAAIDELRAELLGLIDRAFGPTYILFVLVVVLGGLGVANSLYVAVVEREREIGLLRSLGSRRRDVIRLVVFESLVVSFLGSCLGICLGVVLSYIWVTVHVRHVLGWIIDYHFGFAGTVVGVASALIVAPLAAWRPARAAARTSPVLALAAE